MFWGKGFVTFVMYFQRAKWDIKRKNDLIKGLSISVSTDIGFFLCIHKHKCLLVFWGFFWHLTYTNELRFLKSFWNGWLTFQTFRISLSFSVVVSLKITLSLSLFLPSDIFLWKYWGMLLSFVFFSPPYFLCNNVEDLFFLNTFRLIIL